MIPPWLAVVGWLFLVLIHVIAMFLFVRPLWRAHASSGWSSTTCTIDSTEMHVSHGTRGGDTHSLKVSYHYTVDAHEYSSDRVDFAFLADARRFSPLEGARIGMRLPCWYDPDDASSAVLDRTGWPNTWKIWLLFQSFLGIGGLLTWAYSRTNDGWQGACAMFVRVLPVVPLSAMSLLAISGGASAFAATVLSLVAAAAWIWVVYTVREWRRDRRRASPFYDPRPIDLD